MAMSSGGVPSGRPRTGGATAGTSSSTPGFHPDTAEVVWRQDEASAKRVLVEGGVAQRTSYDPYSEFLPGSDDLPVVNGFVNGQITTGRHRLAR